MAKYALIMPREEMVTTAQLIARELGMDVVLNQSVATVEAEQAAQLAQSLGADIIVARGRQASLIKGCVSLPVEEIKLTGQEFAFLLYKARKLVPENPCPRIGVVTSRNMLGDIQHFDEVMNVSIRTYFIEDISDLIPYAQNAMDDEMDVILGGDMVNEYCKSKQQKTLFLGGAEDSVRNALVHASSMGKALDAERKNTAHLQTLLEYSFNGTIELDPDGIVTLANDMACKILDKERQALLGMPLVGLMPPDDAEQLQEVLDTGSELYFSSLKVNGINVVANAANIVEGAVRDGVVFSFYEMLEVQKRGARAMQERYRLYRYLARGRFEDVGNLNREMQRVVKRARLFAETEHPILLQGEVGSGKTLFAQSIHNASPVAQGPFVTFSCAAHRNGQREMFVNAMQEAKGGTLYIDGVEHLDSEAQYVLHYFFENNMVKAAQDEYPRQIEVRVIVSLEKSLSQLMQQGVFRSDLYYVLAPMLIELPPLRTRPEDIDKTIDMCLDDCVTRLSRYVVLTRDARHRLIEYPWAGNYTQLKAFIDRMVLTAPSRTIRESYVRQLLESLYPQPDEMVKRLPEQRTGEGAQIAEALQRNGGNRAATAQELGISKTTLWRKMKRNGIYDKKDF